MRTFEIGLILANVVSLLLGVKRQSKGVWLGVAGINLSIFIIHGISEGFRYQMIFSYLFVLLLTAHALLKTNDRLARVKTTKALKAVTISLALGLLGLSALLAYALPVFKLPKPTGSNAVGIQYFHFVDEKRNDPFLDRSTKKRELLVKVYYPAKEDDQKPFYPYFHHSPGLIKRFTAFFNLPESVFDHLNLVKTNSKLDLLLSDQQQSYPVVLFSHGAGTSIEVQTAQGEDLASQGYIVFAIDHPYVSAATAFPDRIVSAREATTDFNTVDPAEIINQIMADDAKFIIDTLGEINEGKIASIFTGKLDLDRIGVVGHSMGGAVAYNLAINDPRVKAAVDLDGRVFITPKAGSEDMAPFLMLANDKYHVQAIQNRKSLMEKLEDVPDEEKEFVLSMYGSEAVYHQAYNQAQQNSIALGEVLKASGNLYTIAGSDHMKFSDIGLFIGVRQLREAIGIGGKTDAAKCLEITEAVTLAFFDQHLKGETNRSLESLAKKYPELVHVDIK